MITTTNRISGKASKIRSTKGTKMRTQPASRIAGRIPAKPGAGGNGGSGGSGSGNSRRGILPANVGGSMDDQPDGELAGEPCAAELELLAQRLEQHRSAARQAYAEADLIEAELISRIGVGGSVLLTDGRRLAVNDNFMDKNGQPRNVAYKPCGVRRFEVTVK